MPTYDYKCEACGHAFEKFQSMSAQPVRKCPRCAANKLRRLIGTGAGVIFKGGGFYETDYRSDSYKAAAKAEGGGGKADEKAAATVGEKGAAEAGTAAKAEPAPAAQPAQAPKSSRKKKSG